MLYTFAESGLEDGAAPAERLPASSPRHDASLQADVNQRWCDMTRVYVQAFPNEIELQSYHKRRLWRKQLGRVTLQCVYRMAEGWQDHGDCVKPTVMSPEKSEKNGCKLTCKHAVFRSKRHRAFFFLRLQQA